MAISSRPQTYIEKNVCSAAATTTWRACTIIIPKTCHFSCQWELLFWKHDSIYSWSGSSSLCRDNSSNFLIDHIEDFCPFPTRCYVQHNSVYTQKQHGEQSLALQPSSQKGLHPTDLAFCTGGLLAVLLLGYGLIWIHSLYLCSFSEVTLYIFSYSGGLFVHHL